MPNLLERTISQLDMLVPYLSLAHQEVFDLASAEYDLWCPTPANTPMPNTFQAFTTQFAHAGFILGCSYVDAFLADLLRECYRSHPRMLPGNKTLTFGDIVAFNDYDSVVTRMIEHVIHEVMHKGLLDIAKHFEDKLSILWLDTDLQELFTASLIRNCIIHNNSVADLRLAARPDWKVGEQISLSVADVHKFGITARKVIRHVFQEANSRHLSRVPTI